MNKIDEFGSGMLLGFTIGVLGMTAVVQLKQEMNEKVVKIVPDPKNKIEVTVKDTNGNILKAFPIDSLFLQPIKTISDEVLKKIAHHGELYVAFSTNLETNYDVNGNEQLFKKEMPIELAYQQEMYKSVEDSLKVIKANAGVILNTAKRHAEKGGLNPDDILEEK